MHISKALAKELDERQLGFISYFVESGDAVAAAKAAGYAESTSGNARNVILTQPHIAKAVAFAVRARLAASTPMALKVIETIAKDDTLPAKVRLDAAKTLLDRAGHVAPRAVAPDNATETPLHEMTVDQLKDLASRLGDELAGRAKTVAGAVAAPVAAPAVEQGTDLVG